MLKIEVSKIARAALDKLPPEECKNIMHLFLRSGGPPKKSKELKSYKFQFIDIGNYRVIFDMVDDVTRILYANQRSVQ